MLRPRLVRPFILALSIASLALVPATAAAQGTTAGIKGGINLSNIVISGGDSLDISFEKRLGLVVGAFVGFDFNPNVGLQVEGLYSQKGTKSTDLFGSADDLDIRVDYFEIPLLVRGNLKAAEGVRVHPYGGIVPAFKLTDKQTIGDEELTGDDALPIKSFDLGFAIGAMLDIKKFIVDARYTWGLVNVNDTEGDPTEVKNRTFSIMGGFRFK